MPGQAAVGGRFERLQHVGGIRRISSPGVTGAPNGKSRTAIAPGVKASPRGASAGSACHAKPNSPRALREHAGVRDHDEFFGLRLLREQHAQVGPDTGGLAGGDGDHGRSGI